MIWLTWRQFRLQAATALVGVVLAVAALGYTRPGLAERLEGSPNAYDLLTRGDRTLYYSGLFVLALAPSLIAAFWGAPMIARELESGTHRLAWTQTVTRTRWLATKLGLTVTAAALAVGAVSAAVTWWAAPVDGAVSSTRGAFPDRMTPVSFAMRGVAPVAFTVFALVLAVAVGAVLRRTVPAMAVSLALVVAAQIALPVLVRPHLLPPTTELITLSPATMDGIMLSPGDTVPTLTAHTGRRGDWIISNTTVDRSGRAAALPAWFGDCTPGSEVGSVAAKGEDECLTRLTAEGYRQEVVYQPVGRFWALQWADAALCLAAAGLLAGFSFWWTRKRLS